MRLEIRNRARRERRSKRRPDAAPKAEQTLVTNDDGSHGQKLALALASLSAAPVLEYGVENIQGMVTYTASVEVVAAASVEPLLQLNELLDQSSQIEARTVCARVCDSGNLKRVLGLLRIADSDATRHALRLVGNMASDAVDAHAPITKRRLLELGAFELVVPHLWSDDVNTVCYALGALQNMSTIVGSAELLSGRDIVERMWELSRSEDEWTAAFAKGTLHNMRALLCNVAKMQEMQFSSRSEDDETGAGEMDEIAGGEGSSEGANGAARRGGLPSLADILAEKRARKSAELAAATAAAGEVSAAHAERKGGARTPGRRKSDSRAPFNSPAPKSRGIVKREVPSSKKKRRSQLTPLASNNSVR